MRSASERCLTKLKSNIRRTDQDFDLVVNVEVGFPCVPEPAVLPLELFFVG